MVFVVTIGAALSGFDNCIVIPIPLSFLIAISVILLTALVGLIGFSIRL